MNIIETALPGVLIVEPKVFGDARGYFFESWNQAAFEAAGIPMPDWHDALAEFMKTEFPVSSTN